MPVCHLLAAHIFYMMLFFSIFEQEDTQTHPPSPHTHTHIHPDTEMVNIWTLRSFEILHLEWSHRRVVCVCVDIMACFKAMIIIIMY